MPTYTGPRGSGFTSLKQYLELNPESAQHMGTDLANDVYAKGAASENAIGKAMQTFGDKANAATLRYDPMASAEDSAARATATYNGPKELKDVIGEEGVTKLGTQATDAMNRANALGTDYGRATLLTEKYGANGGYTPGAAGLDAFLAGRGAGERGQTAGTRWGGLRSFLDTTTKGAQHLGADAAATTANAARLYGQRANALGQQAAATARQTVADIRASDAAARQAGIRDAPGNLTTVKTGGNTGSDTGTYAGSDNLVSGGRKGPKVDDDLNKFSKLRGFL